MKKVIAMKHITIAVLALMAVGCVGQRMVASSACSFEGDRVEGRYYRRVVPGGAKCSFTLVSPIKRSKDAINFADAFSTMFNSVPTASTSTIRAKLIIEEPTK